MTNFWKIVNQVIEDSDVLLMLLDSRMVEDTRNLEIEKKVKNARKPIIYVLTKCDLVDKEDAEKWKKSLSPCVFVSSKEYHGTTKLRERILIEAKKEYGERYKIWVGVLGYPNVGKSSLINALKGRHSAPTSSTSGFTKGVQKIKADNRITLLDTPGVIPYSEKLYQKHAMTGTIDFNKVKEPDIAVLELMKKFPGIVEKHYKVEKNNDFEEVIEAIAEKKNIMKRGSEPDIQRMAKMILKDWQKGNINFKH